MSDVTVTMATGLVISDQSGFFNVELENGTILRCRLRGRLMEAARSSDIAAIGDRVQVLPLPDATGSIEEVLPRTSTLSRAVRTEGKRGAGEAEREQVIIANADQALFVFAAAQPKPNLRMLDRFLVTGEKSGIKSLVVIFNKIDLITEAAAADLAALYRRVGYCVLLTSAQTGQGVAELRARLQGRLSVFTGPSGVGKTSLLNQIQPGLGRTVKKVSSRRSEGLHTTRDSVLVKLAMGGYLADTPGMRSLTLWDVEPEELDGYFPEVAPVVPGCKFNDCSHHHEMGCAVRGAVDEGKIARSRYDSYLLLRDELEAAYSHTNTKDKMRP